MRKSEKIVLYAIIIILALVGGFYFTPKILEDFNPIWGSVLAVAAFGLIIALFEFIRDNLYINLVTIGEIRRGLKKIQKQLEKEKYKPDIIISLNRSGHIVANMLATQKGSHTQTENVLCVPRKEIKSGEIKYEYGHLFKELNTESFNGKKIVFAFMLLNSLDTFIHGRNYLENNMGITFSNYRVATIYSTPKAILECQNQEIFNKVIAAYPPKHSATGNLNRLPWIIEKYHFTRG